MDCQEVRELLDAYALGAAEQAEAEGLERHVADCVRCWHVLNEAQRTTVLLSLAVAIEEAPPSLRDRILTQAKQDVRLRHRYVDERGRVSEPVNSEARFRVVDARGVCPSGFRIGDSITVGPSGSVAPELCPAAQAVLRLAATADESQEVKEWCCPVFDHLLVFRREVQVA